MEKVEELDRFQVTLLGDTEIQSWEIQADNPASALKIATKMTNNVDGIYSVWDSSDPDGMPLIEETIG